MPRLLDYIAPLVSWLYKLNPDLPQALFVSLVFFSVWLLRKLAPNQWEAFANLIHVKADDTAWWQNELRAFWQALPAAIIGTIYGLLGTGADPKETLRALALSLIAPLAHRVASRYKGQIGKPKPKDGDNGNTDVNTPPNSVAIHGLKLTVSPDFDPSRVARAVRAQLDKLAPPPKPFIVLSALCSLSLLCLFGCAAFQSVTPADRAEAYKGQARAAELACKAYVFDLAAGLTPDVPQMTKLCAGAD